MKPKLVVIVVLLLALGAAAPPVDADPSQAVIDDTDYRFRLHRPNAKWELLSEDEARTVVPEAVAGARMASAPNAHGCLIVERVPKEDIDWYASLVLDNMPVENRRILKQEDFTFQKIPARRTLLVGRINNLDIRYQVVMFFRQGFAYQITAWGLAALTKPDGSDFAPFVDAVELTQGSIRLREYQAVAPDTVGTGWEVRDNVFRSAISGLEVTPPAGWRLVVGDELKNMNDDAEVGLISTIDPEVYMVLTPERAAGVPRASMEAQYADGLLHNQGRSTTVAPLATTIAGEPVKLVMYGGQPHQPFDYRLGVRWDGDMATQVLVWYGRPLREAATKEILRALAGIKKISDTDRSALAHKLIEGGDRQNFVGPTFALRNGRYTDFATGVVWQAPEGIWKITAGQAARTFIDGATLVVEAPIQGLLGVLRHDVGLQVDAPAYHSEVLKVLWGPEDAAAAKTTELKVAGRPTLRTSRAVRSVGDQTFTYVVATGVNGTTGTRLMIWGYPGNVEGSERWLKEAIDGLHLSGAPKRAAEKRDNRWIDRRLGFELQSPHAQWRFREQTPAALRAAGSLVSWASATERVQALAVCNVGIAEKTAQLKDSMLRSTANPFPGTPERAPISVHGVPGEQLVWAGRARMWSVIRGRFIYLLMHEWRPGTAPTLSPDAVLRRFKLLD